MECKIYDFIGRNSLAWVAKISGVHRNTISNYVHNGVAPQLDKAYLIAGALSKELNKEITVYDIWPPLNKK
jgi:transcriptional regulator with XRE-family HTH domain